MSDNENALVRICLIVSFMIVILNYVSVTKWII